MCDTNGYSNYGVYSVDEDGVGHAVEAEGADVFAEVTPRDHVVVSLELDNVAGGDFAGCSAVLPRILDFDHLISCKRDVVRRRHSV